MERQVYDYLVDFPTGDLAQPEPLLASSWEQIDDLTWEFVLREGVTFHEGEQLTADDVKASLELATGFSGESAYTLYWVPVEVEVIDPLRVRLRTEQPFGPMLVALGWYAPILSAAWLGGDPDQLSTQPNGTGPFRLVEDAVEIKTMEANLDYWRDPAKIGTLVWEFIQDPQTRLNALLDGSAQAIDRVPPEHLPLLEERDDIEMVSVTGIETVNLFVRPGRLPLWDENADFRKAVNWSFDRQPLVDSLVLGNESRRRATFQSTRSSSRPRSRPTRSTRTWPPPTLTQPGCPTADPSSSCGSPRASCREPRRSCRRSSPRWSRSVSSRG